MSVLHIICTYLYVYTHTHPYLTYTHNVYTNMYMITFHYAHIHMRMRMHITYNILIHTAVRIYRTPANRIDMAAPARTSGSRSGWATCRSAKAWEPGALVRARSRLQYQGPGLSGLDKAGFFPRG